MSIAEKAAAFISKFGTGSQQTKFRKELNELLAEQARVVASHLEAAGKGPKVKLVYKVLLKCKYELAKTESDVLSTAANSIQERFPFSVIEGEVAKKIFIATVLADQTVKPKTIVNELKAVTNSALGKKTSKASIWETDYALFTAGTEEMLELAAAFTS